MKIREILRQGVLWLASLCHRKPERSFETDEHQSILCVRCSSIYIGFLGTLVFLLVRGFYYAKINILYSLIMVGPVTIDGLTQKFGLRKSNNYLRIVTGGLLGSAFALFVGKSIQESFNLFQKALFSLPNLPFILYLCIFIVGLSLIVRNPNPKSIYLVDGLVILGYSSLVISSIVAVTKLAIKYLVHIL